MQSRIIKLMTVLLAALLANVCWHIYRFAPDYPIGDQWGLWAPLLNHYSIGEGFLYQHGSHFLGVGYLVSAITGYLSGYSLAAESYITAILMAANAVLALQLKVKITGKLHYLDIFIPIMFLNPMLVEVFLWKAHPSVAALPVMFVLLLGHLCLSRLSPKVILLTALLSFCSFFTGYAFLVSGLCLVFSLYLLGNRRYRSWTILSVALQFAIAFLFWSQYTFPQESVCGLSAKNNHYGGYMLTMFFHFFGGVAIKTTTIAALGTGILGPFLYATIFGNRRIGHSALAANLALILFSLTYLGLNTYSRSCIGMEAARAPRYSVFLMPLFLATYFIILLFLNNKTGLLSRLMPVLFIASFLVFRLKPNTGYRHHLMETGKAYKLWRKCYEETGDGNFCSEKTNKKPMFSLNQKQMEEYWKKFVVLQQN